MNNACNALFLDFWIGFRPGRLGGSLSVGLASCDCKSIPLLCFVCVCVWKERDGSGDQGAPLNSSKSTSNFFCVSCWRHPVLIGFKKKKKNSKTSFPFFPIFYCLILNLMLLFQTSCYSSAVCPPVCFQTGVSPLSFFYHLKRNFL